MTLIKISTSKIICEALENYYKSDCNNGGELSRGVIHTYMEGN